MTKKQASFTGWHVGVAAEAAVDRIPAEWRVSFERGDHFFKVMHPSAQKEKA